MRRTPPTPPDKRRHTRVELLAQVQVNRHAECHILSTINISRGGIFIACNPSEHADLRKDTALEICIFCPEDLSGEDANLSARVVRVVPAADGFTSGFGLQFLDPSPEQLRALDRLIEAARRRRY